MLLPISLHKGRSDILEYQVHSAFFQSFDLARGLGMNTVDAVFTPEGSNGLHIG